MFDENGKFTVINKKGEEIEYEVLMTFDSEETKKSYILFTNNEIHPLTGGIRIFANIYKPNSGDNRLIPIWRPKDWLIVRMLIKIIRSEVKKGEKAFAEDVEDVIKYKNVTLKKIDE